MCPSRQHNARAPTAADPACMGSTHAIHTYTLCFALQEAATAPALQAAAVSSQPGQQQQQQQALQQQDTSMQLPMQPPTPSGAAAAASAHAELAPAAPSSCSSTPAATGSSGVAPPAGSNSSSDKGVNVQVLQRYKELLLQTEERCRSAERQASLSGVFWAGCRDG